MSESIEHALAEVWRRSGPLLEERLRAIDLAVDELRGRCAEPTLAKAGRDQAHMLAGVLGTFGLDRVAPRWPVISKSIWVARGQPAKPPGWRRSRAS